MLIKLAKQENFSFLTIAILSVVVPALAVALLFLPEKINLPSEFISLLPHFIATINSLTAVLLVAGFIFIKKKRFNLHKKSMMMAFIMGAIFLAAYVLYHGSAPSTLYGDSNGDGILSGSELMAVGGMRKVYITILLSHILLSLAVVPLVLFALFYAYRKNNEKHRKIVKFAYPIWLYVSVTGVLLFFMIKPFYQF